MCSSALCTMDDASYFLVIRLEPKTSECEKTVTVVCTGTGCDVTNCATTLHGFNKHKMRVCFTKSWSVALRNEASRAKRGRGVCAFVAGVPKDVVNRNVKLIFGSQN